MGLSRRDLLAASGLAALSGLSPLGAAAAKEPKKRRVLRIAHITDIHVEPERGAALGMEKCLEHAQAQKPDLIFMGGDQVMDCLNTDHARVKTQWDLYGAVMRANVAVPVVHAIGNHDVFGWGNPTRSPHESGYGKAFAMDRMHMARGYQSFDRAGWHFVVLDSIAQARGRGYTGRLDEEQFAWLAEDLHRAQGRPTLLMSHIPILSTAAFFHGNNEQSGNWHIAGAMMHIDARRIKDLFAQHPTVVACISGHVHMTDRLNFQGVRYYGNGAGCGNFWAGPFEGVGNGYGIVELFSDGTVTNQYVEYGWKPMA